MTAPTPDAPITPADADAAARRGRQTRDYPMWTGTRRVAALGAPGIYGGDILSVFSFTRDTNPDEIGYDVYAMMRKYPAIAAGLVLLKAPILGRMRQADVQCDDPGKREVLRRLVIASGLAYRTAVTQLRALEFGAAFHELEWAALDSLRVTLEQQDDATGERVEEVVWDGPALTVKHCAEVNPATVKEIRRRTQARGGKPGDRSYDGFIQRRIGDATEDIVLEAAETLLYTHGGEFGNLWGEPRTKPAYVFYWWAQQQWKLYMAWGERKVAPRTIAYFPEGFSGPEGAQVDNARIALATANALDAVNAVALPARRDDKGNRVWEIEEKPTTDRSDTYEKIIGALDGAMFRGMFTPQRLIENPGDTGTYSEVEAMADIFLLTLDEQLHNIADCQNRYLIPRIDAANFPADSPPARLVVTGLTDDERALLLDVFKTILVNPEFVSQLDFRALAERFNTPLRDLADIEAEKQAAAAAQQPAPTGEPPPAGPAEGLPPNVVLTDDDIVALAAPIDLNIYAISPDPKAHNGYKIVNKRTGKRVVGFAADQILKAFEGAGKKAATAAATAARKAAREAESARKKGAAEAKRAAAKSAAEAKKSQREAATAGRKAQTAAERAGRKSAAEAKRAAAERIRAGKAAEREGAKAQRQQATAERKTAAEQKAAARKTAAEQQKAAREQARQQRTAERTAQQGEREQARSAAAGEAATFHAAQQERGSLERDTAKVSHQDAVAKAQAAGWHVEGGAYADHTAAVNAAKALAQGNEHLIVTVVRTKDGYAVASKPKKNIQPSTAPRNVALEDDESDDFDEDTEGEDLYDPDDDDEDDDDEPVAPAEETGDTEQEEEAGDGV